jgi:hypothetical protein
MSNTNKLKTFLDPLGRTIIAEQVDGKDTKTHVAVKNPVIVHIVPVGNSGQMTVQLLPVFFREFLADKTEDTVWFYNKASITEAESITFDFKINAQYQQMFSAANVVVPAAAPSEPNAEGQVKLFDE